MRVPSHDGGSLGLEGLDAVGPDRLSSEDLLAQRLNLDPQLLLFLDLPDPSLASGNPRTSAMPVQVSPKWQYHNKVYKKVKPF